MLSTFNTGPIRASLKYNGSSFGNVVKACYETCEEPVAFVTFATMGSDFVITSFAAHPMSSQKEAQIAGNEINNLLAAEAHKLGIGRLLIVLPHQDTAEVIEEYTVKPHMMRQLPPIAKPFYLN